MFGSFKIKLLLLFCAMFSGAASCAEPRITVVEIDARAQRLELFLRDEHGKPFGTFSKLAAHLSSQKRSLRFAMNAGMFHEDRGPVGLFVDNGRALSPLNQSNGIGNFFMKPNGVFAVIREGAIDKPIVVETSRYPEFASKARLATQSGPMLVIDGAINPAFSAGSSSKLIRNGVCAVGSKAYFAISEEPVNFYAFAAYFKNKLHCANALYLDGTVSSLYSAEKKRNDAKVELGPIIAVVE